MYAKLFDFVTNRVALGDRLGEAFYAVWMVVVSIGLLNSVERITEEHVAYVVMTCFMVNFTWGIIDGVTAMYSAIIARARRDRFLYGLRARDPNVQGEVHARIEEVVGERLSDNQKDRIQAVLAEGAPGANPTLRRYRPGKDDWLYALSFFIIDVAVVVPIVAPLLLTPDVQRAVHISRIIAVVIFAMLGWQYAKSLNRNPWLAALGVGVLGLAVSTYAYETGG